MRTWRIVLVLAGIAVALLGTWIMVDTVSWKKLVGLAVWLGAAIVVHDAIIAPGVFAIDLAMRKAVGRRVPTAVIAIVQSGIVVGSVLTLIVVPEILAQRFARVIPTLLDPDYGMRLGIMWAAIAVVTAGALLLYRVIRSRQKVRPSDDQD
jgi:hypothetical protein